MRPYTTEYVKLTDEEWTRTYRYIYVRPIGFRIFYGLVFLAAVMAFLVLGGDSRGGRVGLAVAVGIAVGNLIGRVYMWYWIKKEISDPQNSKLQGEARAIVDESGITIESRNGVTSTLPWDTFIRMDDLGDIRMLVVGRNRAIPMLRRSHSDQAWNDLAAWIDVKVPKQS